MNRISIQSAIVSTTLLGLLAPLPAARCLAADNLGFVAQFGGHQRAVAAALGKAYYGDGPRLVVRDVANPASPTTLGSVLLGAHISDIRLSGAIAWVTTSGAGLYGINVANPASPQIVGHCADISFGDAEVSGTTLFVVNGGAVTSVNIANPANPFPISTLPTPVGTLALFGTWGYGGTWDDGLHVLKLSDPAAMQDFGGIPGNNWWVDTAVSGSTLLAAANGKLQRYSLANPAVPIQVGEGAFSGVDRIFASGTTICGTAYDSACVYTISAPGDPVLASQIDLSGNGTIQNRITVSGSVAYIGQGNGFHHVNVSNPSNAVEVYARKQLTSAGDGIVIGDMAIVPDHELGGLALIDLSTPTAPVQVGLMPLPSPAGSIVQSGSIGVLGCGEAGLRFVDLANPAAPALLSSFVLAGNPGIHRVHVEGTKAYLSCGFDGLRIVDISNPLAPTQVGQRVDGLFYVDTRVRDGKAFCSTLEGLEVLDVSRPSNIGFVAFEPLAYDGSYLDLVGDRVYLSVDTIGLQIFDISTPSMPVALGSIGIPGIQDSGEVHVVGDRAYLALGWDGVALIDVSDPSAPTMLDVQATHGYAYHLLDTSGERIVVGQGYEGIATLRTCRDEDLNCDGTVDAADLAILLGAWGSGGASDFDGDGVTSGSDLAVLLGAWGA